MRSLLIGILLAGGVYALPAEPALEATANPLPATDEPDADAEERKLKMAVLSGVASKLVALKEQGRDIDDFSPRLIAELAEVRNERKVSGRSGRLAFRKLEKDVLDIYERLEV